MKKENLLASKLRFQRIWLHYFNSSASGNSFYFLKKIPRREIFPSLREGSGVGSHIREIKKSRHNRDLNNLKNKCLFHIRLRRITQVRLNHLYTLREFLNRIFSRNRRNHNHI